MDSSIQRYCTVADPIPSLPSFFLAESQDNVKHHALYLMQRGGLDPEPAYTLKRPDPTSPASQNCYAVALFDAYYPEILYGEVLIRPQWTQPTLSQDEIRRNGGVPPPPEPIMPSEFTIQLYNPELQIHVKREQGTFSSPRYDFSMPVDSFRMPSVSSLDKSQDDPAASVTVPKLNFTWKKEGKITKDMTCFNTGKSTDVAHKRRNKEPDIAVALFKSLKVITVYEPNLSRIEMEDPKGLEVVLLLGAATIRDVFNGNPRQAFNISEDARRGSTLGGGGDGTLQKSSTARPTGHTSPPLAAGVRPGPPTGKRSHPNQIPPSQGQQPPGSRPPITDARSQWEIDRETARLRKQAEEEEKERKRQAEAHRRRREQQDEAEARRIRKMVEGEEQERKRRQREVDKETERLRKLYGNQPVQASRPQAHTAPITQSPFQRPHSAQNSHNPHPSGPQYPSRPHPGSYQPSGVYMQSPGLHPGAPTMMSGGLQGKKPKKSFFNLRAPNEGQRELSKKRSSVW